MLSHEIPVIRGRFLITMVSHAAFFAAIALGLSDPDVLIPGYVVVTFGLLLGLNWLESIRLSSYLKCRYPAEFEKFEEKFTWTGYGPNAIRDLSSSHLMGSGFWFTFRGDREDDLVPKQIRQRYRCVLIEAFSMPPVMFVVIVSASAVSKHYGGG